MTHPHWHNGSQIAITNLQMPLESRPPSVNYFYLNLAGVTAAVLTLAWSFILRPGDGVFALVVAGSVLFIVVATGEAMILRGRVRASSGLARRPLRGVSWAATLQRYLGLLITLAACAAVYWLLPEYSDPFYRPYWRFLRFLGPFVLLLAPMYFRWTGERQVDEEDAYLQLGRWALTLGRSSLDRSTLVLHVTEWMIKAFFLPVMVSYFVEVAESTIPSWRHVLFTEVGIFHFGFDFTYLVDLLIAVVGYTMTLRVLDTQIRSTEPTLLGWLVALVCYRPIFPLLVGSVYLKVPQGVYWDAELADYPTLKTVWFLALMATFVLHLAAMVSFGLRFSNLTHRGIITNGPYRFTKHPHYLAKNISWWLMWTPFLSHGWSEALRNSCLMLLANGLYYLRAKTEERHLMRDPLYVAYSAWIDQHGLFRAWWKKKVASPGVAAGSAGAPAARGPL
jgi:Isoprenylcysteine carboxyl methyltransferase (ICMT) family